uniref:Putative integrase n=1 Tax=termite gut metagenome TaxID=433724 RepID=S0DFL6_9ZZZZ
MQKPIYEVASSHMARRSFIGNIYKQVKDPNLVGARSGHKEGSKAFARYRDIDEDMKKELISFLDWIYLLFVPTFLVRCHHNLVTMAAVLLMYLQVNTLIYIFAVETL